MIGYGLNPFGVDIIKPKDLSDVEILRQIRDANPNSALTTLCSDSKDPYTQWYNPSTRIGVLFGKDPQLDAVMSTWSGRVPGGLIIPPINERDAHKCYYAFFGFDEINLGIVKLNSLRNLTILSGMFNRNSDIAINGLDKLQMVQIMKGGTVNASDLTALKFLMLFDIYSGELDLTGSEGIKQISVTACNYTEIKGLVNNGIVEYEFTNNRLTPEYLNYLRSINLNDDTKLLPQK